MSYHTRPMKWAHCNEEGPLSEQFTEIEIIDEGAGEFLKIYQDASTTNGVVAINGDEWPTLRAAIDAAFIEIVKHEDKP